MRVFLMAVMSSVFLFTIGCATTKRSTGSYSGTGGVADGVPYKDPGQVKKSQNAGNAFH